MAKDEQSKRFANGMSMLVMLLYACTAYWQMVGTLYSMGVDLSVLEKANKLMRPFGIVLANSYGIRIAILASIIIGGMMKTTKKTEVPLYVGGLWSVAGTLLTLLPNQNHWSYPVTLLAGVLMCYYGYNIFFRQTEGGAKPEEDSFLQFDELIDTKYSINIPYHYYYEKKRHDAWINLVAPFRASMVMGVPGSGKSFAVYNKCIQDMVHKGYTIFLYDYKFPDLTEELLTEIYYQRKYENLWKEDKVPPSIYILNFDDAKRSNRCNPIHHSYIKDPADTTEIAEIFFRNINKGADKGGFDFFNESAKVYLDIIIYYLANYDPDAIYGGEDGYTVVGSASNYEKKGCYCTLPHVLEMMVANYEKTFQILQFTHGMEAKMTPFVSALEKQTFEQLMGQVASAQIPLAKFVSPALYWVMTGNDFTLDINDPDEPKIVCMGNNPDRQFIYGTTISLYTARLFALINHKHKRHSAVLLDELPTIFLKGLDNLIATARSNKVAIILGAQDESQLIRDYTEKEAQVILSTVGNILSGQVNNKTAESLSKMFGKEFRERRSKSISDDSTSVSVSFQQEDILPASKIGTLSQGSFVGRVADDFATPIDRKLWYGVIDVDMKRAENKKKEWQKVPIITDFFDGKMPEFTDEVKERMSKLHPKLAAKGQFDKLYDLYIDELVNNVINQNSVKIHDEIKNLIEKEFARTKPFADALAAEREQQ